MLWKIAGVTSPKGSAADLAEGRVKSRPGTPIKGLQPSAPVMSQPPHNSHYVRRVVLPSGREIEVVYFDNQLSQAAPATPAQQPPVRELHVCPHCDSELVFPVEWEEASATHWEVALRCPNCEWYDLGVFSQETVDRFDDELDRGTETLTRDLQRLTQANMEQDLERFREALGADAIWPMDF
jgi:hypothetical protein